MNITTYIYSILLFILPTYSIQAKEIKVKAESSQSILIQKQINEVFVKLTVDTPKLELESRKKKTPVDLVLVLDRSGSMGSESKLKLAKESVKTFINHLNDRDRIALVTFDTSAKTVWPLTKTTEKGKRSILTKLKEISSDGSTNMYSGIVLGREAFDSPQRRRKVIVLSDGMTNTGVTSMSEFKRLIKKFNKDNIPVSTIGMGLDFNERMLGNLADYGMGNYTFVENTANLAQSLEKDLNESRDLMATQAEFTITVSEGVELLKNPSLMFEEISNQTYRIKIGALSEDSRKSIMLAFNVKPKNVGKSWFIKHSLTFRLADSTKYATISDDSIEYTAVTKSKSGEIKNSVNKSIYAEGWRDFHSARLDAKVAQLVKKGQGNQALKEIEQYRNQIGRAEKNHKVKILNKELNQDLAEVEFEAKDSVKGSKSEQATKQKRYSKKHHSKARSKVRKSFKK